MCTHSDFYAIVKLTIDVDYFRSKDVAKLQQEHVFRVNDLLNPPEAIFVKNVVIEHIQEPIIEPSAPVALPFSRNRFCISGCVQPVDVQGEDRFELECPGGAGISF